MVDISLLETAVFSIWSASSALSPRRAFRNSVNSFYLCAKVCPLLPYSSVVGQDRHLSFGYPQLSGHHLLLDDLLLSQTLHCWWYLSNSFVIGQ